MQLHIETASEQETTEVLAFIKETVMRLTRLEAIETKLAQHDARLAAVEDALTGLTPTPDLTPQVTALRTDVDALKAELGATDDEPTPPVPFRARR